MPPLRLERRLFLSRQRNAFFTHGEAEYLLARREGRVVGRITAHIDHAFNIHHDNAWGMFGFLELEDDPEVMAALLDAAAAWLRERDRDRMVGPMDFTHERRVRACWSRASTATRCSRSPGTRPTTSACARAPGWTRRWTC